MDVNNIELDGNFGIPMLLSIPVHLSKQGSKLLVTNRQESSTSKIKFGDDDLTKAFKIFSDLLDNYETLNMTLNDDFVIYNKVVDELRYNIYIKDDRLKALSFQPEDMDGHDILSVIAISFD